MTRKSRWDETDIENTLKDLPPIKDRQSKEDLFTKIEKRAEKQPATRSSSRRNKKPWLYPVMASAAAIFLLVLIVPSFLSSQNEQSLILNSSDDGDSAEDEESTALFEESEEEEESTPEPESYEPPPDDAGEEESYDADAASERDETADEESETESADLQEEEEAEAEVTEQETRMVTLPVPYVFSTATDFVIAIKNEVIETDEELEDLLINLLTEEGESDQLTLPGLNDVVFIDEKTVQLDFTDEEEQSFQSLSSMETDYYREGLQEMFLALGVKRIVLTTEGEDGFSFGADGVTEEWELRNGEGPLGYMLFTTESGETLLVHSSQASQEDASPGSFEETIEWMKDVEEGSDLQSPMPEFDEERELITEVTEENGGITVIFDEEYTFDENSEEQAMMLKALLYTAAEFGYDFVVFEGEGAEQVQGIAIGEEVYPDETPYEQ
ncbi:GerMN domain-containing protein [Alteribacter keqinensis]|uniref:GerMN domain-containing protein n=1 Tax=Alteribacter keqinensis TaxID=2483800 RepID=A0A3M7TLB3_9BACI|nr:GerMN domain-containing protein [Alteribacter keqinensis]RNA66327.1 hypothetical protein EBO34_19630 [Alteribacter keqinensis]